MGLHFVVLNMLNVDLCNWGAIILAINYLFSFNYLLYILNTKIVDIKNWIRE